MARSLVDTNVLVYARDLDLNHPKRARAVEIIDGLIEHGDLVLSTQCLNEFSAAGLRRRVPIAEIHAAVDRWGLVAEVIPVSFSTTTAALSAVDRHHLSFWDALIWATARDAGVGLVLSEDFQHGRQLDGVRFVNPFLDPSDPTS
jgi:predicted nucleic acid-binding protein